MPTDSITYQNSGYFTPIINDYLDQKYNLSILYNHFPTIENFEKQIFEKDRVLLKDVTKDLSDNFQY